MIQNVIFRVLFTLVSLGALVFYIFGPAHLAAKFDTMALGLLGLAALPWLGALVEEFKIGGIEAKLRAIQEEVAEATDTASEAREVAEELAVTRAIPSDFDDQLVAEFAPKPAAKRQSKPKPDTFDPFQAPQPIKPASAKEMPTFGPDNSDGDDPFFIQPSPQEPSSPTPDPLNELNEIAKQYAVARESMHSGSLRTARMTSIFAEMQTAARRLGGDHKGILAWMHSDIAAEQLAAIAWLRNFPAAVVPATYIDLIERTTEPFVQYWGLRALSGRLSSVGLAELSIADRIQLKEIESMMRPGTDRHAQLRRINRTLAGQSETK